MSQHLEEELHYLAQRVARCEPLAYLYQNTAYIIYSLEVNEAEIILTLYCGDASITRKIARKNTAELQALVDHVKDIND